MQFGGYFSNHSRENMVIEGVCVFSLGFSLFFSPFFFFFFFFFLLRLFVGSSWWGNINCSFIFQFYF